MQQVRLRHRVARRGQQRLRQQADRVHVGGAVDLDQDALAQRVHHRIEPGGLLVAAERMVAPLRCALIEDVAEEDRLAEVDGHLAVAMAQHAEGAQQAEQAFLLLRLAGQLRLVAAGFHQLFVADVYGLENHRATRSPQEATHGHRQHAALGRQQATGARTPAFDEVFDGDAAVDQHGDVLAEYGRVQRVRLETAAQEEGATATQDRPDHRQVEVVARGDMRRHDVVLVEQVAQQQVVDVAAVTGHVDNFVARGDVAQRVEMVHLDAVVELVPQRLQQERQRAHHRMRVVGGDLARHLARPAADLGFVHAFLARLVGNAAADGLVVEQAVDQRAPMREVGTDDGRADASEMGAQHAGDLAHRALRRQALGQHLAQADRRGETHQRVAAIEQDRQQPAEAADHAPVLREQHAEPAFLAVRRTADKQRYRHQLHVEFGIRAKLLDQSRQAFRVGQRTRATEQVALAA